MKYVVHNAPNISRDPRACHRLLLPLRPLGVDVVANRAIFARRVVCAAAGASYGRAKGTNVKSSLHADECSPPPPLPAALRCRPLTKGDVC